MQAKNPGFFPVTYKTISFLENTSKSQGIIKKNVSIESVHSDKNQFDYTALFYWHPL
jgi:hypothetical protein